VRNSLFYHRLLQGIQDEAEARGAALSFRPVRGRTPEFVRALESSDGIDGIVAFGLTDRRLVGALARTKLPTALVDCVTPRGGAAANVRSEGEGAAHEAVTHLISLGHRDIGILAFEGETEVVAPRREGYERALLEAGLRPSAKRTYPTNISVEGGYATMRRILASKSVPTALFCCADEMALGAIAAAHERGMHIPRELSVIGFGDIGYFSAPPLSTVRMPVERMGRTAVELLAEARVDPTSLPRKAVLTCEWLPRSTCDVPREPRGRKKGNGS
jgi:DNA-binding LacI/PurR family transcriptional regulator